LHAIEDIGYAPRLPVALEELLSPEKRQEWMREKNLKAFTFWNKKTTYEQIDVLLMASGIQGIFERGKRIQIAGLSVGLASVDDLIAMKEVAGRSQDLSDIQALKQLKETQDEEA